MNQFGITDLSFKLMLDTLKKHAEIEKAYIYGSRAKGTYKPGSDIDIAIDGRACSDELAMEISAELNEKVSSPYYYDVVNYNNINSLELKDHIDRVGIALDL